MIGLLMKLFLDPNVLLLSPLQDPFLQLVCLLARREPQDAVENRHIVGLTLCYQHSRLGFVVDLFERTSAVCEGSKQGDHFPLFFRHSHSAS